MTAVTDWIRPWYPAGSVGHLYADCEGLLKTEPEPSEGTGWLDPNKGKVCRACCRRHGVPEWDATCDTCNTSMSDEWDDDDEERPFNDSDAKEWQREHRCEPSIRLIAPDTTKARR